MRSLKLSEDQLKNICGSLTLQRAENYIGKFHGCEVAGSELKGKIKGNHGLYDVKLFIDRDPLGYECGCNKGQSEFCKHTAALGLTYIYTPWVFSGIQNVQRSEIKSFDDLVFYLKHTKLSDLLEEMRDKKKYSLSKVADISGISVKQLSSIVKDEKSGIVHPITETLKTSVLFLLEYKI